MMVSTLDLENKFVVSVVPLSHPSKAFSEQPPCRGGRDVNSPGRACARLCLPGAGQGEGRQGLCRR